MAFSLPDLQTEDLLLARARRGEQSAIMQIYDLYFPSIYQFIRLRVEERSLAEDLAADVFVRLIDALKRGRAPDQSLRGWLFKVARHEMSRHFGRARRFATTALDEMLYETGSADGDDMEIAFLRQLSAERAQRALRMLPDEQQEVLILRFGQALSLQETADVMGKQVGAIKSLQFRAVNTLRSILGEIRAE